MREINPTGAVRLFGERFDVEGLDKQKNVLPEQLGYTKTLDSEFTEYAYVIHDLNIRKNLASINEYFDGVPGFELLGRWGRWNYNNMDMCIWDAMKLVDKMTK